MNDESRTQPVATPAGSPEDAAVTDVKATDAAGPGRHQGQGNAGNGHKRAPAGQTKGKGQKKGAGQGNRGQGNRGQGKQGQGSNRDGNRNQGKTQRPQSREERIRLRQEERRRRRTEEQGHIGALPAIRPEVKPDTPALRAERVEAIRRDLVSRRRRKGGRMVLRLMLFVIMPTLIAAWFLFFRATPLYQSQSVFMVQGAETGQSPSGGGLLSLFGGQGGPKIFDSIAVQSFILSRDVLRRLDEEQGFIAHFQSSEIDWLHRLPTNVSFEEAFEHYERMVKVSFDPGEGVLNMSLVATTPEDAERFSKAIISYSEDMVDALSDPIRKDTERDAKANLAAAEVRLRAAQNASAKLRKQLATFSVESEIAKEMSIISSLELELEGLRAKLTNLSGVTGEDDPRVVRLTTQVATLEHQIATREAGIAGTQNNGTTLADINAQLQRSEFEVQAAMELFSAAIQAREAARLDAQRQHRYLAVVVEPSLPDQANYPKKYQLVALTFLVLLGLYIMVSLTVSLIREQASI